MRRGASSLSDLSQLGRSAGREQRDEQVQGEQEMEWDLLEMDYAHKTADRKSDTKIGVRKFVAKLYVNVASFIILAMFAHDLL